MPEGITYGVQAFSRNLIGGVLRGVPVGIVEVDDIYGWDIFLKEGSVVIQHGEFFLVDEDIAIAEGCGGIPYFGADDFV